MNWKPHVDALVDNMWAEFRMARAATDKVVAARYVAKAREYSHAAIKARRYDRQEREEAKAARIAKAEEGRSNPVRATKRRRKGKRAR